MDPPPFLSLSPRTAKRVVRMNDAWGRLGISRSSGYLLISQKSAAYDPDFPQRVRLGPRTVGVIEAELDAYIEKKRQ